MRRRGRRPARFCQEQTPVLAEQFSSIDEFIEATASWQASEKRRRFDELTSGNFSRLGRSLGQIVTVLDAPCQGRRRLRGRSRRTSGSRADALALSVYFRTNLVGTLVPADRLRSGARTSLAVRALGAGGRARHLPPAAAARARRRIRPGRSRAGARRCGDRRTAVHGRDAAQRSQCFALGRRRRCDRRRRDARHRAPWQNQSGRRGERCPVRERMASHAPSARCAPPQVRSRPTAWCRCRRRWSGCGSRPQRRLPGSTAA